MEFIALVLAVVGLIGFDLAAMRWGTDSRESAADRDDLAQSLR